jgi:hypothetical protein
MPDPNFESVNANRPGPRVFGNVPANPVGADKALQPDIGAQLGQGPEAVDILELRPFVPKRYKVFSLSLAAARTNEIMIFQSTFQFLSVRNSTNVTDILNVRYGAIAEDAIPFLAGSTINGVPFNTLYLTNTAIAGATMTIMVAQNWPVDQIVTDG